MVYTLYDASISMAVAALTSLIQILRHAEDHPNSDKLLTARLMDDMAPLHFQVHYATCQAQLMAARFSGQEEYKEPEDDLDSYAKMHARIQQTIHALRATDRDTVNSRGETTTRITRRGELIEVPVKAVTGLVNMPNIYFHVSMAYAIMRKEGVPLGKRDWNRGFVGDYV